MPRVRESRPSASNEAPVGAKTEPAKGAEAERRDGSNLPGRRKAEGEPRHTPGMRRQGHEKMGNVGVAGST